MSQHRVYLCQVNNRFGEQVFLPYSVGMIQAYCRQHEIINRNFDFRGFIYLRDDVEKTVAGLERPEIVGISCYVWNWQYSKALAKSVKRAYPDCLVVLGGPQVPHRSEDFFGKCPYVDLLVHNEGEVAFFDILCEFLRDGPDYTRVAGLSVRLDGDRCCKTQPRARIEDLATLPSPYLQGTFEPLMRLPFRWNACHETNRGCPYSCTFCDWGSAVFTRLREFDGSRLAEELEWFGRNRVEVLYNCDANYGIAKRDYDLTTKLAEVKRQYGFPRQFRPAFAKNSNRRVFEIAKVLQESGLQKGVTLSMQSMDDHCLEVVKRKNIRVEDLAGLLKLYHSEGIPTYTELIMGLPGETYDTFKGGIRAVLDAGQHQGCCLYMCELLPNSEMASPDYLRAHGIRSVRMPMLLAYATPRDDGITESVDIVVQTDSMPVGDWKKCFLFAWAVQCFHCLNITQCLAVFLRTQLDVAYDRFYEELLEFAAGNPRTLVGQQYRFAADVMHKGLGGRSMDVVLPEFGRITWFVEEASFLNLMRNKGPLYGEITAFVTGALKSQGLAVPADLLGDLIEYQKNVVVDPFTPREVAVDLRYDLPEYFRDAFLGVRPQVIRADRHVVLCSDGDYRGNLETYALEVVRYGRKRNKLHRKAQ